MRRFSVIFGSAMIIAMVFALNTIFGSDEVVRDNYGRFVSREPSNFHIAPIWTLLMCAGWYGLNWLNFVKEWERRPVLSIGGRYSRTIGPGLVLLEPLYFSAMDDVPVQDVVYEVKAASVQTKDNVSLGLVGVLTYRIDKDKVRDAVVEVGDVEDAVLERALSTLADVGAITSLDQFLEHRDQFCEDIKKKLVERVAGWGANVKAFELKGFKINDSHVENAIAMKAKALKEAEAELARAEMQAKIAEKLNEAASTYDDNGRWLKSMEVMIEMTRSAQNNTIIIPSDVSQALGSMLNPAVRPKPSVTPPAKAAA